MKSKLLRTRIALICCIMVVVLGIIGDVLIAKDTGLGIFQFYTVDSNILSQFACLFAFIYLLPAAMGKEKHFPQWASNLLFVSVCCLMVTFLVVVTVLAPTGRGGYAAMLLQGSMLFHHLLCPILALVAFLLADTGKISSKAPLCTLLATAAYAIVLLLLNIAKVVTGPYPFLHVYEQSVPASCLWFVGILGGAYVLALGLKAVKNRLH